MSNYRRFYCPGGTYFFTVVTYQRQPRRHLDYIHYNPVKHGLVAVPLEWPFSSFPRFVKEGWYDQAWGAKEPDDLIGLEYE